MKLSRKRCSVSQVDLIPSGVGDAYDSLPDEHHHQVLCPDDGQRDLDTSCLRDRSAIVNGQHMAARCSACDGGTLSGPKTTVGSK